MRFIDSIFSIKANERKGILYFFLVLLFFFFGASIARSIAMTLLVEKLGGDILPHMFILIDLSIMLTSISYAKSTQKFSGLKILGFFLLLTSFFAIFVQVFLLFNSVQNWIYGFFFVGYFFFYTIIFIHITSVTASYFTAIQAKRVMSLINAGIPIGTILGGFCLIILLNIFQFKAHTLIIVFAITSLISFSILYFIKNDLNPIRTSNVLKRNQSPLNEFMVAFKYIVNSRLMIYMSLSLLLFVIVNKFLEYHYQAIIYIEVFPNTTQRATFFATYDIFASMVWLLLQLFFTSRIIMKLGVGASNIVYPILSAIIALILVIYFYLDSKELIQGSVIMMLTFGIITQFINQEMRWALRSPASNLLFNAIPSHLWGSNKAFLNGLMFPLSTFIASSFLILITGNNTESYILPLIAVILSILAIIIAIPQWRAYDRGMFNLLNRQLFTNRSEVIKLNNSLKSAIQAELKSSTSSHVIAALEMIRVLKLSQFVNQVGNLLLKTADFQIKQHCVNALTVLPPSNSNITYLIEALQVEQDAKVIPLILKNLAKFKNVNFNHTIAKFLTHSESAVFVEACLCLYHHPKFVDKKSLEEKIIKRLKNAEFPDITLYLYALGELRKPRYSHLILPFLNHSKSEVNLAALQALISMQNGQLEFHKFRLLRALDSNDKTTKVVALKALNSCETLPDCSPIINLLGARDRSLVNESKKLLKQKLYLCKQNLIDKLFTKKISAQQRFEILSLIYLNLNEEQSYRLQQDANEALKNFLFIHALLKQHELLAYGNKTYDLIKKILHEIAEEHLLHVLTVITFAARENMDFFQRVSRGLLSPNRANQGNALEVLSNAGEKYLVNRVLKCFEEGFHDIETIKNLYLKLFNEQLNIDNYEIQLFALDNSMLNECLIYNHKQK
jgi:ATP/ADP translocase